MRYLSHVIQRMTHTISEFAYGRYYLNTTPTNTVESTIPILKGRQREREKIQVKQQWLNAHTPRPFTWTSHKMSEKEREAERGLCNHFFLLLLSSTRKRQQEKPPSQRPRPHYKLFLLATEHRLSRPTRQALKDSLRFHHSDVGRWVSIGGRARRGNSRSSSSKNGDAKWHHHQATTMDNTTLKEKRFCSEMTYIQRDTKYHQGLGSAAYEKFATVVVF